MKKYHVDDQYRTNPMSLKPGGSVIEIFHASGIVLEYDKIKFPPKYLREVYPKVNTIDNPIVRITVDGQNVFDRNDKQDMYSLLDLDIWKISSIFSSFSYSQFQSA